MAVAGAFLTDLRLGAVTWLASAPRKRCRKKLGDFDVLVHGGWPKSRALAFNAPFASSFLAGSVLAYLASFQLEVFFLVPFAAGNFLYIGASDLVPEINKHRDLAKNLKLFAAFTGGLLLLFVARTLSE